MKDDFGLWEEVPGENSDKHKENMETSHRQVPAFITTVLLQ